MRVSRLVGLGSAIVFLSTIPVAAAPAARAALLVPPARVDFDRDGRADTAGAIPTHPFVVRVTLSRTGMRDLMQPARVVAIAGFDYDRDGDIDLFIGTSEGALVWINNGDGDFSKFAIAVSATPPASSSSAWTARSVLIQALPDRDEPPIARNDHEGLRHLAVRSVLGDGRTSPANDVRFPQGPARAPPRD